MYWTLLILAVVLALAYYALVRPMAYWRLRGVEQGRPLPLFGHSWSTVVRTQSFAEWVEQIYKMGVNQAYCGMYQFVTPTLVLRDPNLIKLIGVKDFDHFTDHRTFIPEEAEPFWGKNLFALTGQRWRDMRATLSPSFTSSKMRQMFILMSDSAEQFVEYFRKTKKPEDDQITIELKDTFTRYTNDVIASTAFGVRVNSLEKRDNEFYRMGLDATNFSTLSKNLVFFGYLLMPRVMQFFRFRIFSKPVANFFQNLVRDTIAARIKHNIVRPDMIHLLMEARKHGADNTPDQNEVDAGFATVPDYNSANASKTALDITDEDITAQALIFFFAGFDSVSSLMCFTAYELALHPDIQERLRHEIDDAFETGGGKLQYEIVTKMTYLDMVISETLRKWPNAIAVDRICTKTYKMPQTVKTDKFEQIEAGTVLWIPIFGIHRDPANYPDPERFDPDRFTDENRKLIQPYTYLPFGVGPRNCIGSRFALLETKALFCHILRHFHVVPVKETQIPLRISRKSFNLTAENGFWLGFRPRNEK